jgi:hypothetical protein
VRDGPEHCAHGAPLVIMAVLGCNFLAPADVPPRSRFGITGMQAPGVPDAFVVVVVVMAFVECEIFNPLAELGR